MKNGFEEANLVSNNKNKISKFFVHRIIKYLDTKVTEKAQKIEDKNQEKNSKMGMKRVSYMHLYI